MNKYAVTMKFDQGEPVLATYNGKLIVGSEMDMRRFAGKMLGALVAVSFLTTVPMLEIRKHAPELFGATK